MKETLSLSGSIRIPKNWYKVLGFHQVPKVTTEELLQVGIN